MENNIGESRMKKLFSVLLALVLCLTMLAGCSSESSTADNADSGESGQEQSTEIKEEIISQDEFDSVFNEAKPFEGEIKLSAQTVKGEDIELEEGAEVSELSASKIISPGDSGVIYNTVYSAFATSTLSLDGYNYNVGNMLDWDLSTCWAEGNKNSEGTMEGFAYMMDAGSRVDGFRIYPGYQKSQKAYKNNILPAALLVEAGGYSFTFDLDNYLMELTNDDGYYWIDCYFGTPVYTDSIYVTIGAVTTYGNDPDYDCCITEFHPFHY